MTDLIIGLIFVMFTEALFGFIIAAVIGMLTSRALESSLLINLCLTGAWIGVGVGAIVRLIVMIIQQVSIERAMIDPKLSLVIPVATVLGGISGIVLWQINQGRGNKRKGRERE